MQYNPNLTMCVTSVAQELLDRHDMLSWSTIAFTYVEDDNLQVNIMNPKLDKPIVLGFATFRGIDISIMHSLVNDRIEAALAKALMDTEGAKHVG